MPITNTQFHRMAASYTSDILSKERRENFGFTSQSQTTLDSINPIDFNTIVEDMHKLWLNNPLAYRFIETFNHFVSGDGLMYKAKEEEVQKVLDNFWKHPLNKWEIKFQERMKGLSMSGELILKPSKSEFAGKVKTSNLYPGNVGEIYKTKDNDNDNDDDEQISAFKFKNNDKPLKVIKWIETEDGEFYDGDVFYFQINKTPFMTRGLPDAYFWRDWLKLYDKNLYSNAKRSGLLMSFIWDVTMTGANKGDLLRKEQQIKQNPPLPGAVRVHNETEAWKSESPNLNAKDIKELNDLIKSQNIAGSGMPEWYYGLGGDTNLGTARVMSIPFYKNVKARKDYIKYMFTDIFKYVIWIAVEKSILTKDMDKTFEIISSEPDPEKAVNLADSLFKFAQSAMTLSANGIISSEESKSLVNLITNQLGVEIDKSSDETQNEKTMQAAHKFLQAYNKLKKHG